MKGDKIYCIGDSHVSVFLGIDRLAPIWPESYKSLIPNFEVIRLGPITAYNVCEYNRTSQGREKLEKVLEGVPDNSWIIISAGEIDCRVHLIKQAELQNKSFEEVAANVASRFVNFIGDITKNRFKVCLLLPPPTSFRVDDDPDNPKYGSEVERNKITGTLIKKLISECSILGIPTINIFEQASTPELETKRIYLWDGIHLSTYALPDLIYQLRDITKLKLIVPPLWRVRESLRKLKKLSTLKISTI